MRKQKFLVVYDISENKKRSKVANMLLKFGIRVQLSCFELECSEDEILSLLSTIEKEIDKTTDIIFIYPILKSVEDKVIEIGIKREKKILL